MRKISLLIGLVFLLYISSFGQNYVLVNTFSATGTSVSDNLIGNGAAFHKLTWNVTGTVSGCTVALDSSVDGSSWSAGGVIAGQTCTSNGTILSVSSIVNYVRINMTAFVGTGTVTVIDQGFINNPSGGGGSGTVGTCAAAGNAYYSAGGTTTTCDTNIVDGGDGTLNISLGTITVSKPYVTVTQTWNAGGVSFVGQTHTITCTAAASGSTMFNYIVGATSIYSLKFGTTNCGSAQLQIPEGTTSNPGLYFPTDGNTTGWWRNGANDWVLQSATVVYFRTRVNNGVQVQNSGQFAWSGTSQANGTIDSCFDRPAAGLVRLNATSTCNDTTGVLKTGNTLIQTAANFTTTNTTATTWLSKALPAIALNATIHCEITYQESVNTAGLVLGISNGGTNAPTSKMGSAIIYTNTTGAATTFTTGTATDATAGSLTILTGGNVATGATSYRATLDAAFEETALASTLTIQAWNSSAATLTILRGSYCTIN